MDDINPIHRIKPTVMSMDNFGHLCTRIEKVCRHSLLDIDETDKQAVEDHEIVFYFYRIYRGRGDNSCSAKRLAKTSAISAILSEVIQVCPPQNG